MLIKLTWNLIDGLRSRFSTLFTIQTMQVLGWAKNSIHVYQIQSGTDMSICTSLRQVSTRKQLHMYIQFCLVPSPIWVAKTQVWPARVMQSWFLKCLASCTLPEGHPNTSLYVTHWQGTAEFLTFFMHAVVLGWLVARSIWRLTQYSFYVFAIVPLLSLPNVHGLTMSWPEPRLHVYDHVRQHSAPWPLTKTLLKGNLEH